MPTLPRPVAGSIDEETPTGKLTATPLSATEAKVVPKSA
jgi:hypothetical protein